MADLKSAEAQLDNFKKQISAKQFDQALLSVSKLKIAITGFPSAPPLAKESQTRKQELMIARDMLEQTVLLSASMQDDKLFERNFEQLRPYYTDLQHLMPKSELEYPILGLNLIRLLTQTRIAEFHIELELLPREAQSSAHIAFPRQLEQQLMEGAYAALQAELSQAPSPHMAEFCAQLAHTVRDEMASCAALAYKKLLLPDAAMMLGFTTQQDLLQYCGSQGWHHDSAYIYFDRSEQKSLAKPSLSVFHNMLTYVRELDRIV